LSEPDIYTEKNARIKEESILSLEEDKKSIEGPGDRRRAPDQF
jgi:hypothetical protein